MRKLTVAVAQFEPKDGDKDYNISVMDQLAGKARARGADVVSFHELSVTAYTFLKNIGKKQVGELAENVPGGPACRALIGMAKKHDIVVLAGLLEADAGRIYNTYVCLDSQGMVARHRKLHPFIHPVIAAGDRYTVFKLKGWNCGILVCYDNNVIENVRATVLLGAELIFAPHVTACTPSARPGSGYVDDRLWQQREAFPDALRAEFDGPKGREWLMKWLPARAYDNGVYYAFTNPVGYDGEQLKNGNSMILDPFGDLLCEVKSFEDDLCLATVTEDKLALSGGYRYRNARRPELYKDILGLAHRPVTAPAWLKKTE